MVKGKQNFIKSGKTKLIFKSKNKKPTKNIRTLWHKTQKYHLQNKYLRLILDEHLTFKSSRESSNQTEQNKFYSLKNKTLC